MTGSTLLDLVALVAGLAILAVSGDHLVRGASAMALRLGVRPLIVGLTVVAFGTSAPELVVGIEAVLSNAPGIAVGNIVGSNIANVFLVLGLPAVIAPIAAGPVGTRRNAVIGLAAAGLMVLATIIGFQSSSGDSFLGWQVGVIALILLSVYLGYLFRRAKLADPAELAGAGIEAAEPDDAQLDWLRIWLFIIIGAIGLVIGGQLIVYGAQGVATGLGVPPNVIALTLVALGTSLPELAATLAAAIRRRTDLAMGNVLGSNIFNILAVGGATAVAAPFANEGVGSLRVPGDLLPYDYGWMVLAAVALLLVALRGRGISRLMGAVFLAGYVAYLVSLGYTRGMF